MTPTENVYIFVHHEEIFLQYFALLGNTTRLSLKKFDLVLGMQSTSIIQMNPKTTTKEEQIIVSVRYCFNYTIHEEFIGIAEAHILDANGLSLTIVHMLQRVKTNIKNCVGQGYGGASVVSGHLNGIQKISFKKQGQKLLTMSIAFAIG